MDGIDGRGGGGTLASARYVSRRPVVDFDLNSLFMLRFHTDVLGFNVSCVAASWTVGVVGLGIFGAVIGDKG